MRTSIIALLTLVLAAPALAQSSLPPVPAPQAVPRPGPVTKGPYQPQALLPGGIVMPLFRAGSPYRSMPKRVSARPRSTTMDPPVPGRVALHRQYPQSLDRGASGGGQQQYRHGHHPGAGRRDRHQTLRWSGWRRRSGCPSFFQYSASTPSSCATGCAPTTAMIPRPMVSMTSSRPSAPWCCAHAARNGRLSIRDKIGVMGSPAGAELTMAAAIQYPALRCQEQRGDRSCWRA